MVSKKIAYVFLILLVVGLAACSGGKDSTEVSSNSDSFADGVISLSVAERVTVVDAKTDSDNSASSLTGAVPKEKTQTELSAELAPYDIPGDTPYYNDETRVWVAERSAEVFGSVNSILCFLSKLQYQGMLNQGDYVAQIDMKSCENNTDASGRLSEGGQSSSSEDQVPQYTRWVVNSSRLDRSSPHIVKAWVEEKEGGENSDGLGGVIYVLVTITESKSTTNPLGIFRLDYGGHPYLPDGSLDTNTWLMRGFIETYRDPDTSEVLLNYVSDEHHDTDVRNHKAVLNRNKAAQTGIGSVYAYSYYEDDYGTPYESEENYDFSYNDTHFLRGFFNSTNMDYDSQSCYSRYYFDENVWRYGLYNSTGQRVEKFSGLPLRYNDGAQDFYGWISYYGLWFPDQVTLTGGETVYSQDYDTSGSLVETTYEAFVSGGKLLKYTKGTVLLGEVGNVPLNWSEDDGSGNWINYIAIWNPNTQTFQKTAIVDYDLGTTTDIVDVDIDLTGYYNITFWSESLGGSLRVDLMDPATGGTIIPVNGTTAITYTIEVVYPGSEDPALATNGLVCFFNCLNPTPGVINSTNPFHTKSTDNSINQQYGVLPSSSGVVNAVTYSFDSVRMQLIDDATGLDVVLNEPSLWSGWGGIQGGGMIINTPADIDTLACASGSKDLCAWKLWDNSPVFYTWETGIDQWNRLSALKDPVSGDFVSFEPPIKVEYIHHESDPEKPGYKYDGSKFFLEYYGFGDLSGIPGECVDPDTGDPMECGEGTWWTPSFSIPTGTELENVETAELYLAKALEKQQKMTQTSTLLPCQRFTLTHYTLPDISQWLQPDIGDMPEVSGPPKVIDGEVVVN